MTTVHVELTVPKRGTTTRAPAKGLLEVSLYHREVEGGTFVLTPAFTQVLVNGTADLQLTPTTVGNAWVINERTPGGRTRFVVVPDMATVNYSALVEVAPGTLDPYPALGNAYQALESRVSVLEALVAAGGGGGGNTGAVTDNGDGTYTANGFTTSDNNDGTFTTTGAVTDNGDGTFVLAA